MCTRSRLSVCLYVLVRMRLNASHDFVDVDVDENNGIEYIDVRCVMCDV